MKAIEYNNYNIKFQNIIITNFISRIIFFNYLDFIFKIKRALA